MDESEVEKIAEEVMNEYNQSDTFKKRFMSFYSNTVRNNLGSNSLEKLIESVELPEEDQIDES